MKKAEAEALLQEDAYEPESYEEAAELFEAIFDRAPDKDDGDQGTLFSHCCAGVTP